MQTNLIYVRESAITLHFRCSRCHARTFRFTILIFVSRYAKKNERWFARQISAVDVQCFRTLVRERKYLLPFAISRSGPGIFRSELNIRTCDIATARKRIIGIAISSVTSNELSISVAISVTRNWPLDLLPNFPQTSILKIYLRVICYRKPIFCAVFCGRTLSNQNVIYSKIKNRWILLNIIFV